MIKRKPHPTVPKMSSHSHPTIQEHVLDRDRTNHYSLTKISGIYLKQEFDLDQNKDKL